MTSKNSMNPKKPSVLMLLSNAFNPDPRVHREATALIENGYSVTILCWDRDLKELPNEKIDKIEVQRIFVKSTHGRGGTQIFFLFIFWLKALLKAFSQPVDIVHAHDFDTLPLGYLVSKIKGAKLVYDAHESYIDMLLNVPRFMKWIVFHAENWLMKRTDFVITVGEILKKYLIGRGAKKVCVVGNWQDPEKFKFGSAEMTNGRKHLGISDDQVVIVFISHLGTERKLPQLIEAVKQTPSVFLIIGGNGPCRQLVSDAAESYNNITYLGFVQPATIPFYTALSDIVFYGFDPSVPNAAFSAPNKLFEGLAAGKAILTGNFGEIEKIVRETNCGIVLNDYSVESLTTAIAQMGAEQIRVFGKNAKKAGETRYNWGQAKRELFKHYEGL